MSRLRQLLKDLLLLLVLLLACWAVYEVFIAGHVPGRSEIGGSR